VESSKILVSYFWAIATLFVCGLQTASLVSLNVGVDLPVCISRRDSTFHPCVLKILLPYAGLHTCGCMLYIAGAHSSGC